MCNYYLQVDNSRGTWETITTMNIAESYKAIRKIIDEDVNTQIKQVMAAKQLIPSEDGTHYYRGFRVVHIQNPRHELVSAEYDWWAYRPRQEIVHGYHGDTLQDVIDKIDNEALSLRTECHRIETIDRLFKEKG